MTLDGGMTLKVRADGLKKILEDLRGLYYHGLFSSYDGQTVEVTRVESDGAYVKLDRHQVNYLKRQISVSDVKARYEGEK